MGVVVVGAMALGVSALAAPRPLLSPPYVFSVPEGRDENSPPIHRWEKGASIRALVPEGRLKQSIPRLSRPYGTQAFYEFVPPR